MSKFNFKIPEINFEELREKKYMDNKENPNNLSFWFNKVKDCGLKVPETLVIDLDYDKFKWLESDKYTDEAVKDFSDFIQSQLKISKFNTNRKLFIKTGTFSNKFDFKDCAVTDLNNIGRQFLNIYYTGMIFGASHTAELIVREFIESSGRKTIYNGLPLNTEFRVFYDFTNRKVVDVFNYWDTKTMIDSLKNQLYDEDAVIFYKNFLEEHTTLEKDFESHKAYVCSKVAEAMANVDLEGEWSIDLMKVRDDLILIYMALAHQSYYFDKIKR